MQLELTITQVIAERQRFGIQPLMMWSNKDGIWIPCQNTDPNDIDRMADKLMFSDGLVWHPDEQCFTIVSGYYMPRPASKPSIPS